MGKKEHRPGVSDVNLVARHIKLEEADSGAVAEAVKEIDEIFGMDGVSFDERTHVLNLAYDASITCIECMEEILQKHRIEISHGWWTHFKEGYYRFVDQNVKDNAGHEPFSCHKMPPHK